MLVEALIRHVDALVRLAPELRRILGLLDDAGNLSELQALMLSAVVLELRPNIIIDLGTGNGNSAVTFSLSVEETGKVYTFDLHSGWNHSLSVKLAPISHRLDGIVTAIVGDLLQYDFTPLVRDAERILVFWDAHGYDIAQHVLGNLMPLISDKPHFVICHDMTDNRFVGPAARSYGGKRIWRGMDDFYKNPDATVAGIVGWAFTIVDQVIPIFDFCWRNDMEFRSFDQELHAKLANETRNNVMVRLGLPEYSTIHMGYFTMNETNQRFFPGVA